PGTATFCSDTLRQRRAGFRTGELHAAGYTCATGGWHRTCGLESTQSWPAPAYLDGVARERTARRQHTPAVPPSAPCRYTRLRTTAGDLRCPHLAATLAGRRSSGGDGRLFRR